MKSKSLTSDYTLFLGGKREVSWFEKNLERKLGDGRNLSFWHENWLANESLASKYKKFFLNSCQKKNLVGDVALCFIMRNGVLTFFLSMLTKDSEMLCLFFVFQLADGAYL